MTLGAAIAAAAIGVVLFFAVIGTAANTIGVVLILVGLLGAAGAILARSSRGAVPRSHHPPPP